MTQQPTAYKLAPTAPPREWSPLVHGGRTVCVGGGEVVINLPAEVFCEGDATLASVVTRSDDTNGAAHANCRIAGMLLRPHDAKGVGKRKRPGDTHAVKRRDVANPTFTLPCDIAGGEFAGQVQPRCVYLLEELRADDDSGSIVGVRLWKVFIDQRWRESRALGLAMEDEGSTAPRTPAELLQLYIDTQVATRSPLLPSVDDWLRKHSPSGDWAARTLLRADEQRIVPFWGDNSRGRIGRTPSRLHPLSPELVLSPDRPDALVAGLMPHIHSIRTRQRNPAAYRPTRSAVVHDDGELRELRFSSATTVLGLHPHTDPLVARLPPVLLRRLLRAAMSHPCVSTE
jgi:hypothetical protein